MGTLREDVCTLVTVSNSVLLGMGNVSDRSCRENDNTHFILNNSPPPPHRWQYNMVQKRCDLYAKINKTRIQIHAYNI